jgi:hypothetical protein
MKVLYDMGYRKNITNAGDYLVRRGVEELLKYFDIMYDKCYAEDFSLNEIQKYSALIIGGGPQYSNRLYKNDSYKVYNVYKEIQIPIFFEGAGIYNSTCLPNDIFSNCFIDEMIEFYKYIDCNGGGYGCRDYISQTILKKNGLLNGNMIGCPAWFSKDDLQLEGIRPNVKLKPEKIIVSDAGITKLEKNQVTKAQQTIEVIEFLKDKFKSAKIIFSYNNGIHTRYSSKCNNIVKEYLEKEKIDYYNMENNEDMFAIYDDCDLHIGFRLHSHIYCMRKHIPSILIEEDARGYGFNDTVGLPHITAYKIQEQQDDLFVPNEYLIDMLDFQYEKMINGNFVMLDNAYKIMKNTFYNERTMWMEKIKSYCK